MGFITDLLKDVPLSAVIKEKLISAEKEILILQTENKNLKISLEQKNKEIERLNQVINSFNEGQSIKKLNDKEYKILKYFYDRNEEITIGRIAQNLSIEIRVVEYHVEKLLQSGFIELTKAETNWIPKEPAKYGIKQQGRAYIIENQP